MVSRTSSTLRGRSSATVKLPHTVAGLETVPEYGRHYADTVLAAALPIGHETAPGFAAKRPAGATCATLRPGEAATKQVPLGVGANTIEVAPGGPVAISLRRFAQAEFPVELGAVEGGTTTTVQIPRDRAQNPWYVHVESAQLVRVCRPAG